MSTDKPKKFSYPRALAYNNEVFKWNTKKERYESETTDNIISRRQFDTYIRKYVEGKNPEQVKVKTFEKTKYKQPKDAESKISTFAGDIEKIRAGVRRESYRRLEKRIRDSDDASKFEYGKEKYVDIDSGEILDEDEIEDEDEIITEEERLKLVNESIYFSQNEGTNGTLYTNVEFLSEKTTINEVVKYARDLPDGAKILIYAIGKALTGSYAIDSESDDKWVINFGYSYNNVFEDFDPDSEDNDGPINLALLDNIDVEGFQITYRY